MVSPPDFVADNDPSHLYAKITVNGRQIAEIYETGIIAMPNDMAGQLSDLPSGGLTKLDIAKARIAAILERMPGAKIEYVDQSTTATSSESTALLSAASKSTSLSAQLLFEMQRLALS